MFELLHQKNGRYFHPQENDKSIAEMLKYKTCHRLGKSSEDAQLMTNERYFRKHVLKR